MCASIRSHHSRFTISYRIDANIANCSPHSFTPLRNATWWGFSGSNVTATAHPQPPHNTNIFYSHKQFALILSVFREIKRKRLSNGVLRFDACSITFRHVGSLVATVFHRTSCLTRAMANKTDRHHQRISITWPLSVTARSAGCRPPRHVLRIRFQCITCACVRACIKHINQTEQYRRIFACGNWDGPFRWRWRCDDRHRLKATYTPAKF